MSTRHDTAKNTATALLAGLFALILAAPALADHRDRSGKRGVTVFHDVHYRGRSETFYGDISNLEGSRVGNDTVSSVAVSPGCKVTLYKHAHFRGPSITLRDDLHDLRGSYVGNDEVSSLTVRCRGGWWSGDGDADRYDDHDPASCNDSSHHHGGHGYGGYGATMYSDAGFRGRSETFRYDDPSLRDNRIRQDTISSVRVSRGCRVMLYSDTGYRGRVTVLRGENADLRRSEVGNDRTSSIRVDCR